MTESVNYSVNKDKYYDILQTYFEWSVSTSGYYWDDTVYVVYSYIGLGDVPDREHHRQGPFLLEKAGAGGGRWENTLEEHPTLFRVFAELPPTRQCILDFANSHGMLSTTTLYVPMPDENTRPKFQYLGYDDLKPGREFHARAESFYLWKEEIQQMRWITQLWDWIKEEDEQSLQTMFHLVKEGESFEFSSPERKVLKRGGKGTGQVPHEEETQYSIEGFYSDWSIPYRGQDDTLYYILADKEIVEQFSTSKDLLAAASKGNFDVEVGVVASGQQFGAGGIHYLNAGLMLLQDKINDSLLSAVRPTLIYEEEATKLKPYLRPYDLLAALWTEFYLEVSGQKDFKRCGICGLWEDVTNKNKNWKVHPPCAARRRVDKYQAKRKQADTEERVTKPAKKPAAKKPTKKAAAKKKGVAK